MSKILIIPTYNEKDNVRIIYSKIRKYNSNLDIVFIDDNSPDGTIEEIKKIIKKDKKVKLILRKNKQGIGSAHKAAILWSLKKKYKLCITMDSDLTHNPRLIPRMIKLSKKYDLVQTNRFFNKNSIKSWPLYRRVLTKLRFILLYLLLGIKYDSSGAFRCYNFNKLNSKFIFYAKNNSYSFFWETIYIFTREKCKIKELSITQKYRVVGSSKLALKDWFHGLYYLFVIFIKDKLGINYKN